MLIIVSIFISSLAGFVQCDDGYKHFDVKKKLKLYEPPIKVQNYHYPNDAPAAIMQTWKFSSYPWIRLKFSCTTFKVPQNPPCENYFMEIKNGAEVKKYCGEVNDLIVYSTMHELEIKFKTGKLLGGGKFNCEIVGYNPEFTTIAPPTTTQSYLNFKSIEIDSSEFGVTPGKKGTTCTCGWTNKPTKRIIGGKEAEPNEYPFMAALISKEVGLPFCGVSIITKYHGLTAAHCTDKLLKYEVEGAILVGEHDYTKDSTRVDVYDIAEIIQHRDYTNDTHVNDISLLRTKLEIKFNPFIGRVCLPTKRLNLDHQYVKMLGWGRTDPNGESSPVLRKINIRIVPIKDCLDVWSKFIPENNPKHLCTFAKNKTTCQGDSGGPAIWLDPETNRYTQVGLTSFGLNCSPNIPSVKTEVAAHLDWIHFHIKASTPKGQIAEVCTKDS
uniref:Venom S1 protease with CUB domain 3 n=1 Tax=Ectomocoris sp. TaxID=3104572 RepID=A0AB38ZE87_9HEMI